MPEVWLRGAIAGVPPALMPVAHSLLQVREELEAALPSLSHDQLWARPGGAASIGFHLKHLAGSLDRLLTYARGEPLTAAQLAFLDDEERIGPEGASQLLHQAVTQIDRALTQTIGTPPSRLDEPRPVGRAALPSTIRGLLFHAAEHAQRHAGQIATTIRLVKPQQPEGTAVRPSRFTGPV
jgi:uncharacterized damage-inducible protein DinB